MDVILRPFHPDDTQAVIELWRACDLTRPWNDPAKDMGRKLAVQPELFVVAAEGRRIIGTVMAGYEGHRGWVNYLAVAPDARRRGVATRLMQHVEQALHELGCPKINLQVRQGNDAAQRFYEALGYACAPVVSMGKRLIADDA